MSRQYIPQSPHSLSDSHREIQHGGASCRTRQQTPGPQKKKGRFDHVQIRLPVANHQCRAVIEDAPCQFHPRTFQPDFQEHARNSNSNAVSFQLALRQFWGGTTNDRSLCDSASD
jgi:hypothetical protein